MNYMKFFPNPDETANAQGEGIARVGFSGNDFSNLLDPTSGGNGAVLNFGDPSETVTLNIAGQPIEVPSLLALISFLKRKNNANILSTPNIIAMDNEESTIEVGDEVPIANNPVIAQNGIAQNNIQTRDATILLKIKPFISPDSDIVRLNVEQSISKVSTEPIQAANLAANAQGLSKKEIKTNIVLESGQTAVLGGLMEDEDSVEESKIPFLGDIPVLGWLFKSSTTTKTKNNLVVFLTPQIIRNSAGHKKILRDKMTERIDWIKKNNGGRDPYGERFNNMIRDHSASARTFVPNTDEVELDLEEAIPLGEEPAPAPEPPQPIMEDEDFDFEEF
jgi:general secretion pathway protein D